MIPATVILVYQLAILHQELVSRHNTTALVELYLRVTGEGLERYGRYSGLTGIPTSISLTRTIFLR